tara:strand:- start:4123 stop:11802 length:7680 start_codon:yes stop_codon:yes gene_type:complete
MASIVQVDPNNFSLQVYDSQDENLISSFDVDTVLTASSYIEFFIYENNTTLAYQNYSYINYSVENDSPSTGINSISQFNIDPEKDLQNLGFDRGDSIAYYNFLTKEIGDPNQHLYIKEISSDRTELRLDSNTLTNLDIIEQTNAFVQKREDSDYFLDFYLNLGNNDLLISNNVKIDNEDTTDPTILVKLYEPLPPEFDLKSELWVVTTLNEPEAFRVSFPNQVIDFDDTIQIQGPNLNLPIKDQINNSTQPLSYNDLIASNTTSSFQQLNSLISASSLQISIDYSDFNEFCHFSSAKTRLENFNYKVGLIETYSASIADLSGVSSSATSVTILENKIGNVKQNFDGFEYYLYYSSGSTTYPKTTSTIPYELAKTDSTEVLTWLGSDNESSVYFGGQILSASNFDNQNPDNLLFSIPEYLREDSANQPYDLFVAMVGQHFDSIWVYTKDITQKYNADNRLDYGVSKDLVADTIRDFGLKLYQNNFSKDDLYTAFLGMTPNGALFPFPDITGSLPTPSGYEYVNTMISTSTTSIPLDDVNKSIYKRIYHNLPYLIQSKGTIPGLRALITSYGIPDTILKISEFGGKDKTNIDDWDYYFNKFNYAFDTNGNNFISTNFPSSNTSSFSSTNYPFSASQSGSYTTTTGIWTEIQRITGSEDGQTARVLSQPSQGFITSSLIPNQLLVSNYGFNIPTNATITGFEVTINRNVISASGYSPLRNVKDRDLYLSKNTSSASEHFQGTNKADTITEWPRIRATASYGSPTDLWGQTWTPAEVNSPEFGLQFVPTISASGGNSVKVHADFIGMTAYYNVGVFEPNSKDSIEFRFKAEDILPTNLSQSLWSLYSGSTPLTDLTLEYAGSGSLSGSYSASIKDPYYQYANLKFYPSSSDTTTTASVYLPFFDGGWWSVMVTSGSGGYNLYAKNKIYNGKDGTQIGYESSSQVSIPSGNDLWGQAISSYFATSSLFPGFSGSLQEIRYYNTILSESRFNDYVMNPLSIEGNTINSSPNELIFRAPLGSELGKSTSLTQISIHPKITGSWIPTQSFGDNSNYNFNTPPSYSANTEYYFLDQPAVGIKNRITDKVRFEDNVIPTGDTLSPYRRVTQHTEASASYTPHINLLEVAFSPQNEINDDIIGQLGYFNLGDYIGDPRQRSSSLDYYPDLNNLRDAYFEKYLKNYDLVDFVRLIKFFDNSLFKMIKDFIPARTSLASGLVVKQHLLERNKYPQPQLGIDTLMAKYPKSGSIIYNEPITQQNLLISGTVSPQWNNYNSGSIENLTGGAGGSVNPINYPPKGIQFAFTSSGTSEPAFTSSLFAGKGENIKLGTGTKIWNRANKASGSENMDGAYTDTINNVLTYFLDVTDYGFSLPSNAFNINVNATIIKKYDDLSYSKTVTDEIIQLITGSSTSPYIGSNLADISTDWPTSYSQVNYVGFGGSLTPTMVNSSSFGLRIQADIPSGSGAVIAYVDSVQLDVSYKIPDTLDTLKINSDARGTLEEIDIADGSNIYTSSLFNLYDGENIFPSFTTIGNNVSRSLSWETITEPNKDYSLNLPLTQFSTLTSQQVYPFSGSTPTSTGDKVRWQTNDLGFYAVRYMPVVNPILTTGGYYPATNAQQWQYSNTTLSGSISQIHDTQDEFYNGEYSGSVMLLSNGNLNPGCDPYKNNDPTPVPYKIRWYHTLEESGQPPLYSSDAWLSEDNEPLDGYISLAGYEVTIPPYVFAYSNLTSEEGRIGMKIAKRDANGRDQSNSLKSLEVINFLTGSFAFVSNNLSKRSFIKINTITEHPNYYSYNIDWTNGEPVNPSDSSSLSYNFTGSISSDILPVSKSSKNVDIVPITNVITDNLDFFNTSNNSYQLNTYIQKDIQLIATGSINIIHDGFVGAWATTIELVQDYGITDTILDSISLSTVSPGGSSTQNFYITASIPGYNGAGSGSVGSNFNLIITNQNTLPPNFITGSYQFLTSSFYVTSSTDVGFAAVESIPEPYLGNNDFSRAFDCQPSLGNATIARENKFLQDVDYTTDITVPTNIGPIIDGTAVKGTVPESNYTILKSINPRYKGSRSTSLLNQWIDISEVETIIGQPKVAEPYLPLGTYGKEPNVESQQNLITYCDWIESSFPERNDTVKAHIQYLIKDDGNVSEPNINKFSTPDIQHTFPQGQNCIINLNEPPEGLGMEVLNGTKEIVKGGYRIEPILTLQSGSLYSDIGNVYWNTTGSFIATVKSKIVIGTYIAGWAKNIPSDTQTIRAYDTAWMEIQLSGSIPTPSSPYMNISNGEYTVTEQAEKDGIIFVFNAEQWFKAIQTGASSYSNKWRIYLRVYKDGVSIGSSNGFGYTEEFDIEDTKLTVGPIYSPAIENEVYTVVAYVRLRNFPSDTAYERLQIGPSTNNNVNVGGFFSVQQTIAPTNISFSSSSPNSLWGYPDPSDYSRITASDSSSAINLSYGSFKQEPIPNSLFKTPTETWNLQPGDEFRYEDREDRVYMVKSFIPPESHPSGTLEVLFNNPIPSSSVNLDHFLIRRYVPDGSSIIIFPGEDTTKPSGSTGTALVSPQYTTDPLDKGSGETILDLTEKGLI